MGSEGRPPGVDRRIETLAEAGAWLEGLINMERLPDAAYARFSLAPIRRLLERLGHPEKGMSVLHVAGSKGKGSTCLYAESILRALGERTGTFTSPHLSRWTERFRVDGAPVPDATLARAVDRLRPAVEAQRASEPEIAPTFFDATTAAALLIFAEQGLDRVILEVGLGGRLDSTNAVTPAVTAITSIELEHTDKLGDTLAAIASEKAGILETGVPCVMGRLPPEAAAVVRARAEAVGAPLRELGVDFDVESSAPNYTADLGGLTIRGRSSAPSQATFGYEADLCAYAPHQADNAALAVEAALLLRPDARSSSLEKAVKLGLAEARIPGVLEIVSRKPWVVVDAAHTAASARALAAFLERIPAKAIRLLLSVSADKQVGTILDALLPVVANRPGAVTVTQADSVRSIAPAELEAAVRARAPSVRVDVIADPRAAATAARESLADDELLCVAGSIYLAGVARDTYLAGRAR